MAESTPSVKKNFILSTGYQVLLVILPLITAPYVSRVLGSEGIGIYSVTNANQTYFAMIASLGTASYGAREIARARDSAKRRSILFWEIELMTVFTTILALIAWNLMILWVGGKYTPYYLVLTMSILAALFDISWFYTGMEQFAHIVTRNGLFKLLGVVMIFLFVRDRSDTLIYVAIMSATILLGNLSMWTSLPRYLVRVNMRKLRVWRHLRETMVYFIPTIATSVYTVLDKTLIGAITHSESENGYYEQATKIINMMKAVTFSSLNAVLGARISYLFEGKRYDEIRQRIRTSINYIFFMGMGICFGLIAVAPRFVPWFFGPGYGRVVEMLRLMAPIIVIIGVSNCLGSQFYTPAGYRKESAMYIIAGSCANFGFNCLLIPRFGGYGAIVASLIAETVITVLYLRHCRGYLRVRTLVTDGWKKLLSGAVMMGAVMAVMRPIGSDFLALVVGVVTGVAVYCGLLYVLRDHFLREFLMERILGRVLHRGEKK